LNAKIEHVSKDIEKTKEKNNEFQARRRELEKQKTDLENIEIVEAVRGTDIPLTDLASVLKAFRKQGGTLSSSGQHGPKQTAKTDTEKEETEQ
jgi:Cu/Ag efflux pump CusA